MMNANFALFSYHRTKWSTANTIIFSVILLVPVWCFASLILGIVLSLLLEKVFSQQLPSIAFQLLFIALVGYSFWDGSKNQLSFLEVNDEAIAWKTWIGKPKEVQRSAITHVTWEIGKVVINKRCKISIHNLPLRAQVEFITLFMEWVPEESLPDEMLTYLRWKKQIKAENMNSQNITTRIATGKRRLGWPRSMSMDETGIIYSSRGKQRHFFWDDIEAIAFQLRTQKILIWQGERHMALSYKRMDNEAVNDVYQGILRQSAIKDIPFALI